MIKNRETAEDTTVYIPIAIHKNELVVIDSMDTFSRYFCLAKKQKMTPLAVDEAALATPEELEEEHGEGFFEDEEHSAGSDGGTPTDVEEDDI